MNNMDDTTGTDQSPGGLSRRDMIKASVAAGALVWSAPVLLSGKAFASHEDCPCAGTLVRLNISAGLAINCGSTMCLDNREPDLAAEVPCGERADEIICAIEADNLITFSNANLPGGRLTITLDPMLTFQAGAIRQQGGGGTQANCFYTDCDALSTMQVGGVPNTMQSGAAVVGNNRIWVPNSTTIEINTVGVNITAVDLLLCVSAAVTGVC